MTTLHVLRIHNNWNGPDILDHFFNFDSFQGIVLVVRVLDNPLAMGSHHSKIYWILVAQGVTTSPILGVGKILANNCLSNNNKKNPHFWALPFTQESHPSRFLASVNLGPSTSRQIQTYMSFLIALALLCFGPSKNLHLMSTWLLHKYQFMMATYTILHIAF